MIDSNTSDPDAGWRIDVTSDALVTCTPVARPANSLSTEGVNQIGDSFHINFGRRAGKSLLLLCTITYHHYFL